MSHALNLRTSFEKSIAPGVQIHAGSYVSSILLRVKNAIAEAPVRWDSEQI